MVRPRASQRPSLLVCYMLELLALAIWIGGLVVIIASVIPAVFNSLAMEAGGRFLTRVFQGYNVLITLAIVILVVSGAWRTWLATRRGYRNAALSRPELVLSTVMIVIAALIIVGFGPATVQLQEQAFSAREESIRKVAYEAFFRSHMIVRALYVINLGLGIALTTVKIKNWLGAHSA
jgi:uncharacterized membrane protein